MLFRSSVHWMGAAPWQLGEEQRAELEAAKAKNIKAIEESKENYQNETDMKYDQ